MTIKSKNITWHEGQVSRTDREGMLGQKGCTIWLTGLSGSGKSTIAVAAEKALNERGRLATGRNADPEVLQHRYLDVEALHRLLESGDDIPGGFGGDLLFRTLNHGNLGDGDQLSFI